MSPPAGGHKGRPYTKAQSIRPRSYEYRRGECPHPPGGRGLPAQNLRKQRKGTHMRHMIFGESHGPAIGVVLEGVPAGLELDLEAVQRELDRRKPGQDPTATARRESDTVQVLSLIHI